MRIQEEVHNKKGEGGGGIQGAHAENRRTSVASGRRGGGGGGDRQGLLKYRMYDLWGHGRSCEGEERRGGGR